MIKEQPIQLSTHADELKVAMSFRLSPTKIARAQGILGTPAASATIEEALDLVGFGEELVEGVDHAFGVSITDAFPASRRSQS